MTGIEKTEAVVSAVLDESQAQYRRWLREQTATISDVEPQAPRCDGCLKPVTYDLIIPDDVWARIAPKPVDGWKGGGVLCPECIVSALTFARQAPDVEPVAFEGIAKRKLDGLLAQGWKVAGYAISKDGCYGLVTTGAFVGWFTTAEENARTAEAENARLREALRPFAAEVTEDNGEYRTDWQFADDKELVGGIFVDLTFGDFRSARAALAPKPQGETP